MPDVPASEQIGSVLGGKYRLTGLLGEGGMGRVFSAEHILLGRQVAVKVLHPKLEGDAEFTARFLREARAASSVEHPGIIDVLDADRDETGTLFMVMELLQGESLAGFLKRKGRLEPGDAIEITRQMLGALHCAHEHGIIHRDLKPDNIFLVEEGSRGSWVRILDFGISKVVRGGDDELKLTHTGVVLGTPHYMSPEQARGSQELDHRVDIWALGVILYQMLAGRRPYTGSSYNEVILAIAVDPLPPLAGLAPHLTETLVRCVEGALAKNPNERYGSVAEMAQALEEASGDLSSSSTAPDSSSESMWQPPLGEPLQTERTEALTGSVELPTDRKLGEPDSDSLPLALHAAETPPLPATPRTEQPTGPVRREVGGFWRRSAALIIDLIVFALVVGTPVNALLPESDVLAVKASIDSHKNVTDEGTTDDAVASGLAVSQASPRTRSIPQPGREWEAAAGEWEAAADQQDLPASASDAVILLEALPTREGRGQLFLRVGEEKLVFFGEGRLRPLPQGGGFYVQFAQQQSDGSVGGRGLRVDQDFVAVRSHSEDGKFLLFGVREGHASMVFGKKTYDVWVVTGPQQQLAERQRDVEKRLVELPGVQVARRGDQLVLEGVVSRRMELEQVNEIVRGMPLGSGSLVSFDFEQRQRELEALLVDIPGVRVVRTEDQLELEGVVHRYEDLVRISELAKGLPKGAADRISFEEAGAPPGKDNEGDERVDASIEVNLSNLQLDGDGVLFLGDAGDEIRIAASGILFRESGGDELRIDETGVRIREADGSSIDIDALNIAVVPTMATTLKISIWILLCTVFLTLFAATPGKMVLGLKVVEVARESHSNGLSMLIALTRSAMFVVSVFVLGLGCFWSVFDGQRRTWHDRIARTLVIRSQD